MHVVLVVAVMLLVLWSGRGLEQRMFERDPARKAAFRHRLYAWNWRAAVIALLLAIVLAFWLRHGGSAH